MLNHYFRKSNTPNSKTSLSRRLFFRQTGAAIFTTAFLTSCSDLLDKIDPGKSEEEKEPEEQLPPRDKTLAFFGDSLTIGAGGSAPYGTFVGAALPERTIISDGIVGQFAKSGSVMQGGTPLTISIDGDKFNGVVPVDVTKMSNQFLSTFSNNREYSRSGTLAGVKCRITRTGSEEFGEKYTVLPDVESMESVPPDSVFQLDEVEKLRSATQIFWYGRNNIGRPGAEEEIITALDNSIAYITEPARFLVVGILLSAKERPGNEKYNEVMAINDRLASKYGKSYVPMTQPTAEEMAAIGYTPSEQDQADLANNDFPAGMRADVNNDEIHLNDMGYKIVANRVVAKIKELKY